MAATVARPSSSGADVIPESNRCLTAILWHISALGGEGLVFVSPLTSPAGYRIPLS